MFNLMLSIKSLCCELAAEVDLLLLLLTTSNVLPTTKSVTLAAVPYLLLLTPPSKSRLIFYCTPKCQTYAYLS